MAWVLGFVGGGGVAALASGIWVLDPSPVQFLLAASATLSLPCVATIHTHPFPHNLQLHKMELPLRPWARPGGVAAAEGWMLAGGSWWWWRGRAGRQR